MHQLALLTDRLKPAHKYVPWITINQAHTEDINKRATTDLLKLVCQSYSGPKLPKVCTDKLQETLEKEDAEHEQDMSEDVVINVV